MGGGCLLACLLAIVVFHVSPSLALTPSCCPPHPDGWPDRLVSWLRACLIPILACNGQRYKQRLCKCLVTVGATLALPWACHGGSISTVMELLADLPASWLVPEPEAVNGGLSSAAR